MSRYEGVLFHLEDPRSNSYNTTFNDCLISMTGWKYDFTERVWNFITQGRQPT